jgi:hypothetical protein
MAKEPGLWPVLLVGTCLLLGMVALVIVRALESQSPLRIGAVASLLGLTLIVGVPDAYLRRVSLFSRAVI